MLADIIGYVLPFKAYFPFCKLLRQFAKRLIININSKD